MKKGGKMTETGEGVGVISEEEQCDGQEVCGRNISSLNVCFTCDTYDQSIMIQ